jgi:chromosome segregation ATPase
MFDNVPPEILIPALSAIGLAALAHIVTILMQIRSNKHDFSMKTFESVTKELSDKNDELSDERKDNRELSATNVQLLGEKYLLEANLQVMQNQRDESREEVTELENDNRRLKEKIFQLNTEVEVLKKTNEKLTQKIEELDS